MRAIAGGDKEAFADLFYQYEKNVFTAAVQITRSEALAEEIVQDSFLKIWLKREDLTNINDFKSYLFVIARNFSLQVLRRTAYERRYSSHIADTTPAFVDPVYENPLLAERYRQLEREAVQMLPERQRQAYQLVKMDLMKREEAAAQMQVDVNTIKVHLTKAMRAVRAYCLARMDVPVCIFLVSKEFF